MTAQTTGQGTTPAADTAVSEHESGTPRVVVLGGGVAGLTAAHELHRRLGAHAEITLVSDSDHFTLGLGLIWVPFGRKATTLSFSLAPTLAKHAIAFRRAYIQHISLQRRVVLAGEMEIPYDYLLIATGPRADGTAIPGVSGLFNATASIWNETEAVDARHELERFLASPGPVVVGAAQGASYLSAAYEFALLLDYELRRRGTRAQAALTFITPEPYLGHLDVGAPAARTALERLFARRHITALTGAAIARVDRAGVHLSDGRTVPAAYSMVMPPFTGITSVWQSPDLADEHGFVPVDAQYRHLRFPAVYAVGVAAHAAAASSVSAGVPKTGYLSAAMARAAAQNIAAAITGGAPAPRALPRLVDLRLIDGGDAGVLLVTAERERRRPVRLAIPLPGRAAHRAKGMLARYVLWKLHGGHTTWP